MKGWTLVTLCATASCAGTSFRPLATERTDYVPGVALVTVEFEVACDSCRVVYGPEDDLTSAEVQGGWSGASYLGTLRDDQRVPVLLQVTPYGDAVVVSARIGRDGRTIASAEGDEPGGPVSLRARVGA